MQVFFIIYSFTCLSLLLMLFCLTAAHVVVVVVVVVVAFCVEVQRSRANLLTGVVLDLGRTARGSRRLRRS